MIRMNQFRSSREAKDYYTAALKAGDYYTKAEQDCPWRGELAKRLGLGESVTQESFAALAENVHPVTGEQLTPRTNADRTTAYDINFHVPKGVSVLHLVSKDDRIIDAIRESMRETMREIELQARTRVRVGGQKEGERQTGELVWGEFLHTTTRPDKAGVPDIHLHAHCYVFNVTWDAEEQRMKAVQFRDIKRDMPYHQAAFYSRLAWRLEELGYRTERSAKGWDVEGMPESVKWKFSRRTAEIEAEAKRRGINDPARKAEIGARTRGRKTQRLTPKELRSEWLSRIEPHERAAIEKMMGQPSRRGELERGEQLSAKHAIEQAIGHKFEPESVVAEPRLLESALRFGLGTVRPEAVRKAANAHPDLLRKQEGTQRTLTTRAVLAEEMAMLTLARDGRGMCKPLEGETPWQAGHSNLSREKQRAMGHLLGSSDRIMLVRGGAGTGKTHLLKELSTQLRGRGHTLVALASTSDASRRTLRQSGFAEADTIAAFLGDTNRQEAALGGVIWADEAGLTGTETMLRLFETAKRLNARVILCGDTKQHAPAERGDALRLIETRAGLLPAELTEVVRQQGTYKQAVEALHKGQFDKGIQTLDQLGAIREVKGDDWTPLVFDYLDSVKTGRTALVIAPTHKHGEELTTLIRAGLRRDGKIGGDDRLMTRLRDLRWTKAERSDAARYEAGQVVTFNRTVRVGKSRFAAGERFEVIGRDEKGRVRITNDKSGEQLLPLTRAASFGVNAESQIRLSEGDTIRASANGRSVDGKHRVNNGAVFRVAGFAPNGNLLLDNGWEVSREFGRIEHAYVSTSHAAQGRTVDRVLIAQSGASLGAASAEQLYVSVSRGRYGVGLYTEDRKLLLDVVNRMSARRSAVELAEGVQTNGRSREHAERLVKLRWYEQHRDPTNKAVREQNQQRSRQPIREHGRERT